MLRAILFAAIILASPAAAEEATKPLPPPVQDLPAMTSQQTAVLAGGCFWGMQGVFQHVKGVTRVVAGYSGGSASTAHYNQVSWGDTGHAESVKITFDPHQFSYGRVLQVYFSVMDPTTLNYQGPDEGTQYRSVIFAAGVAQRRVAEAYIAQLSKAHIFSAPIVTRVSPLRGFYPAEPYHQDYLIRHPTAPYIMINDLPKIAKLHRFYPGLYRQQPITLARN